MEEGFDVAIKLSYRERYAMKKGLLLILPAVLALLMIPFVTLSHAAIGDYDLSNPKDGDVDGKDLAAFISSSGSDIAGFAGAFGQTYTVATRPPNILLIIADDVGMDLTTNAYPGLIADLVAQYGPSGRNHANYSKISGRPASLPVLTDRLATQGMVFANAWAQPFCSPTRATIITGLFVDKTKVGAFDEPMSDKHVTFVKKLKDDANYSTAVFGKWHLAGPKTGYTGVLPKQVGFELFKGHLDSAISPTYWSYNYLIQDEATSSTTYRTESAPTRSIPPGIAATTFEPVVRAADTIEWIQARQAANPNKPWFVWLAFNESHVLVPPDQPYYHVPNADTLDATSLSEVTGCGGQPGSSNNGTCTALQLMRAMTNSMDTAIGKVLDKIETLGSDTYVIYIGDNGSWSNNIDNMYITTSGRGKTTPYESGARVPMVIWGPGIAAGRSTEFVHAADLFATILTLAGLTPPAKNFNNTGAVVDSDSVSLTPILFGSASAVRDPNEGYLLTEVAWNGNKVGARNATYKVICNTNTSNANCTFYNLITDPLEEYALSKPTSCSNYRMIWDTANPEWHYCRLIEVMTLYSIFP
jgi:arylsulfatase A-like enzyme